MKEIEILIEVKSSKEVALKALEEFSSSGIKTTLENDTDIFIHLME